MKIVDKSLNYNCYLYSVLRDAHLSIASENNNHNKVIMQAPLARSFRDDGVLRRYNLHMTLGRAFR
jgi:hypothetical protein